MTRALLVLLSVELVLSALAQAQAPEQPHSAWEPPAAKAAVSLTESTKASPRDLLTTSERTEWVETGLYSEAVDIARRLERASHLVHVFNVCETPEGRQMIGMIVSKDRAFTPAAAARTGKAIVMIQSGIHSGEIEGKDTVLMLVRDMTVTGTRASWLDHAIFVIIPVFNVDGHDQFSPYHRMSQSGPRLTGLRATAQRLNLNRDYIKGDSPEMRGWLSVFNSWMPDFLIDNHVTDGSDIQYDVTWDMARNQDIAEPARSWVNERFIPELDKRMAESGHLVAPYGALRAAVGGKREFYMEVFSPRYSHIYAAVQNRPSLLVETHSLKAGKTRAWADYDIMRHSIDTILLDPEALRSAVRKADQDLVAFAGNRSAPPVYLGGTVSAKSRPLVYHALKTGTFKSEISGSMITRYLPDPDDISTVIHDQIDTVTSAQMPLGYLIPAAWKVFADELALHSVVMERTTKPIMQEFETYRLSGVKFGPGVFEGRVSVNFETSLVKEKRVIPAGSWWVPMTQRRSRLILAMLEPQAPDSLVHWGFSNSIFEGGGQAGPYLMEPVARMMMASSPELTREFEQRLASDPAFAADSSARLTWWFERSQYDERSTGAYPIVRIWEKSW
jgi:hypothetical protein